MREVSEEKHRQEQRVNHRSEFAFVVPRHRRRWPLVCLMGGLRLVGLDKRLWLDCFVAQRTARRSGRDVWSYSRSLARIALAQCELEASPCATAGHMDDSRARAAFGS